ncbi:putative VQ motif-containing protein 9 [Sesbania bispinosa]|nr:putative VQ motif-containing protein 9 [Sesbania bispinosa]
MAADHQATTAAVTSVSSPYAVHRPRDCSPPLVTITAAALCREHFRPPCAAVSSAAVADVVCGLPCRSSSVRRSKRLPSPSTAPPPRCRRCARVRPPPPLHALQRP